MGVGGVRSCGSYQGGDIFWSQKCTIAVMVRSNWFRGPGGSPLVGCSRNSINLERKIKSNSNSLGINSAH